MIYAIVNPLIPPRGKRDKDECFCTFTQLTELPFVADFLKSEDKGATLSEQEQQLLKDKVYELGGLNRREYVTNWEAGMLAAFSDCGLDPITSIDGRSEKPSNILEHACAFFRYSDEYKHKHLASATEMLDKITSFTFRDYYRDVLAKPEGAPLIFEACPDVEALKAAKRLSDAIGMSMLSMSEMESFGKIFTCRRCSWAGSKSWCEIVSHQTANRCLHLHNFFCVGRTLCSTFESP